MCTFHCQYPPWQAPRLPYLSLCVSHAASQWHVLGQRIEALVKLHWGWASHSPRVIVVPVRTSQAWAPRAHCSHSPSEPLCCEIRSITSMACVTANQLSSSLLKTAVYTSTAWTRSCGLCLHPFLPVILLLTHVTAVGVRSEWEVGLRIGSQSHWTSENKVS